MERLYGFRNIKNLVRRIKPAKMSRLPGGKTGAVRRPAGAKGPVETKDYAYVEVMACPGGCTNGGGQVKVTEVEEIRALEQKQEPGLIQEREVVKPGPKEQKEWLAKVDEAYYSGSDSEEVDAHGESNMQETNGHVAEGDVVNGIDRRHIKEVMTHWSNITGVDMQHLLYTSFRKVESDVGKKQSDMERVAGLAVTVGGGW